VLAFFRVNPAKKFNQPDFFIRSACFDQSSGQPRVNPGKQEGGGREEKKKSVSFLFEVSCSQRRWPRAFVWQSPCTLQWRINLFVTPRVTPNLSSPCTRQWRIDLFVTSLGEWSSARTSTLTLTATPLLRPLWLAFTRYCYYQYSMV